MNIRAVHLRFCVLCFCVSCTEAQKEQPPSLPKGDITGRSYQNRPIGEWTYYDEHRHAIKHIFYLDSTGRNYEARYFDTQGKVVYLERIEDGLFSYQQPRAVEIEQGRLLYREYCGGCHGLQEASIAPALCPVTLRQPAALFFRAASNPYHRSKYLTFEVPVTLNEQDFGLIYKYIKNLTVPAVN